MKTRIVQTSTAATYIGAPATYLLGNLERMAFSICTLVSE